MMINGNEIVDSCIKCCHQNQPKTRLLQTKNAFFCKNLFYYKEFSHDHHYDCDGFPKNDDNDDSDNDGSDDNVNSFLIKLSSS